MGVVYEAFDRERQQRVALKTLLNSSPAALLSLQARVPDARGRSSPQPRPALRAGRRGGRSRLLHDGAGQRHRFPHPRPEGGVAPGRPSDPPSVADDEPTRRELWSDRSEARVRRTHRRGDGAPRASPADIERLRPALCQLVEGVRALHAAGKLHRDIKPSNVRVTPEGRVVVLDFGVATELSRVVDENLQEGGEMVGTARYMAPEQALNEGPTAACDWYSVGVMLYEALVGSPPFVGSAFDVLKMKSMLDPPPPGDCVEGVPADLDAAGRRPCCSARRSCARRDRTSCTSSGSGRACRPCRRRRRSPTWPRPSWAARRPCARFARPSIRRAPAGRSPSWSAAPRGWASRPSCSTSSTSWSSAARRSSCAGAPTSASRSRTRGSTASSTR